MTVRILGGFQTDFAKNWSRKQASLYDIMAAAVEGALERCNLAPADVDAAHIGNFAGEQFSGQGHLGGFFASLHPAFSGIPTSRHETACASGSAAVLAASADIEAGRADVCCVVGIEQMKTVPGDKAADHLAAAAWRGREATDATYLWPRMFSDLADEYDRRYGLRYEHLMAIAKLAFDNAKRNPNAQSRAWNFDDDSFAEDDRKNPVIEGRIRRQDCAQITDGAAAVILASESFAKSYADSRGVSVDAVPGIRGWGHRTAPMLQADKLEQSRDQDYVFPHVRGAIEDARRRADVAGVEGIDGAEVHDCFTITEYMLIEHLGAAAPGRAFEAIEAGDIEVGGKIPINPSGGLIGGGHPVGASGVRMLLDAHKQVTHTAGDYQIEGARTFQTVNIGGSATTTISFVVGVA